ncbi:cell division protein ZapA [Clostridium thermarum]|uniref:cell division protein ZapA n=1 Tax=Clostridium thermarum TaxID=1716543 RepID=UPI00111FCF29|nr:cell division protein ZapA [Clostridium thermarum]
MNIVTVKINGVDYNLKGDEKEEYLHRVAGYVDKKIKLISESNRKLSTTDVAVLTAVNAVDDLFKCDMAYQELCEEIQALEAKDKENKHQIEALQSQLQQVQQENQELLQKLESDNSQELLRSKDEEVDKLKEEISALKEASEKYLSDYNAYKAENKELKFQLQSARYKIIDLQNKLVENQINLVKVKKMNNPLINNGK